MVDKEYPVNRTEYKVYQYTADGKRRLWIRTPSAKGLEELRSQILASGADYQIVKSVVRETDVTSEFDRKGFKE